MTMFKNTLGATILVTALAVNADAQTPPTIQAAPGAGSGSVSAKGKVVGPSNEPQPGVAVQIIGPLGQTTAITDRTGTWSVYNLPAGEYKAKAIVSDKSQPAVTFSVREPSSLGWFTTKQAPAVVSPELKLKNAVK
jgi:hypothetical protein